MLRVWGRKMVPVDKVLSGFNSRRSIEIFHTFYFHVLFGQCVIGPAFSEAPDWQMITLGVNNSKSEEVVIPSHPKRN